MQYNGDRVFTVEQLALSLAATDSDVAVALSVHRDGVDMTFDVTGGLLGTLVYDDYAVLPVGPCEGCGAFL
ncbi:MAG: hypothetical protein AAF499_12815 [Pseudomonadota bacterium]